VFYLYRHYLGGLNPADVARHLPELAKNLDFELDNVRYTHTRSGVKKWELSTHKAKRVKGQDKIILEGVEARIFSGGRLKSEVHILADRGSYQVKSGNISLYGRIRIMSKDFEIDTGRLDYFEDRDLIVAPDRLTVKSKSLTISAPKAEIKIKSQSIHFFGGVKSRIKPDSLKSGPLASSSSPQTKK